jgi:hypothetical protein
MASGQRSSGRLQDMSSRLLISMPVQQTEIAKWVACKSFLGNHHLLVMLLIMSLAIRAPKLCDLILPVVLVHLLAWACCLSKAPASQRSMHTITSLCGILSLVLRFMVSRSATCLLSVVVLFVHDGKAMEALVLHCLCSLQVHRRSVVT